MLVTIDVITVGSFSRSTLSDLLSRILAVALVTVEPGFTLFVSLGKDSLSWQLMLPLLYGGMAES